MIIKNKEQPDSCHAFMPYPYSHISHSTTGQLCGLTFAVKDLFHVSGYPTSGGQPLFLALSGVQNRTAPVVKQLLDAGAIFTGKTITDELAFSMNGQNSHFGSPINGAAPKRITGGSSSGSASAVSNGLCDFGLGTDTGGSVRVPASHCGLLGIRPTHGRICLKDVLKLSPSFDTCGWLARDMPTFSRVADVLFGKYEIGSISNYRLMLPSDIWALITSEVTTAMIPALNQVEQILGKAQLVSAILDSSDSMYWSFRFIQAREAWNEWGEFIQRYAPVLGSGVAQRFVWSAQVTDDQVAMSLQFRKRYIAHLTDLLGDDGVLVLPSMPDIAPGVDEPEKYLDDYRNRAIRILCVSGLSGFPQLSLPLARRLDAPLGISLIGAPGSDRALVQIAEAIWANRSLPSIS